MDHNNVIRAKIFDANAKQSNQQKNSYSSSRHNENLQRNYNNTPCNTVISQSPPRSNISFEFNHYARTQPLSQHPRLSQPAIPSLPIQQPQPPPVRQPQQQQQQASSNLNATQPPHSALNSHPALNYNHPQYPYPSQSSHFSQRGGVYVSTRAARPVRGSARRHNYNATSTSSLQPPVAYHPSTQSHSSASVYDSFPTYPAFPSKDRVNHNNSMFSSSASSSSLLPSSELVSTSTNCQNANLSAPHASTVRSLSYPDLMSVAVPASMPSTSHVAGTSSMAQNPATYRPTYAPISHVYHPAATQPVIQSAKPSVPLSRPHRHTAANSKRKKAPTETCNGSEVIDLLSDNELDVPPLVPPNYVPSHSQPQQQLQATTTNAILQDNVNDDNEDNITDASSLSPILSPRKTARRSFLPQFPSFPMQPHFVGNFEINHTENNAPNIGKSKSDSNQSRDVEMKDSQRKKSPKKISKTCTSAKQKKREHKKKRKKSKQHKSKQRVLRKHCYNTRSNMNRGSEPDEEDVDIYSVGSTSSSSDSSSCVSNRMEEDSKLNIHLSAASTMRNAQPDNNCIVSALCIFIDLSDQSVKLPAEIVKEGRCPIALCTYSRKFKNERLMKQHILTLHSALICTNQDRHIYFLCRFCNVLYCTMSELEQHAKVVHDNHEEVEVLLSEFRDFCGDAFEIRCSEFGCNEAFLTTKEVKNHMRDRHNYHHSDILMCKYPTNYVDNFQHKCMLNAHCQQQVYFRYHDLVNHYTNWHFVSTENAVKLANIWRYKFVNHLHPNHKRLNKLWRLLMHKEGYLSKAKVEQYLNGAKKSPSISPQFSNFAQYMQSAQSNESLPNRQQCVAALRTGIAIDRLFPIPLNNNTETAVEKIADLMMSGCEDEATPRVMLQEINCAHLNHDGSKACMEQKQDLYRYMQYVNNLHHSKLGRSRSMH